MDLVAEPARFNPDPALADWITDAVQKLVDQAQKDTAEVRRQIMLRDTELRTAQNRNARANAPLQFKRCSARRNSMAWILPRGCEIHWKSYRPA